MESEVCPKCHYQHCTDPITREQVKAGRYNEAFAGRCCLCQDAFKPLYFRLLLTSNTHVDWNHESQLTRDTLGVTFDEVMSYLKEIEPYCDGGKFGPGYDWKLVEA